MPGGNNAQDVMRANAAWWNVSNLGSPDGVISTSALRQNWSFLPLSPLKCKSGYQIIIEYTASAATTLDISDGVGVIPVRVNGQAQTIGINGGGGGGLGNNNFTSLLAGADSAYVAGQPTPVAIVYAKEGVNFQVGGDVVFLSLEDNA